MWKFSERLEYKFGEISEIEEKGKNGIKGIQEQKEKKKGTKTRKVDDHYKKLTIQLTEV